MIPFIQTAKSKQVKLYSWIQENKLYLNDLLQKHGAVLLRGFDINSISEFNQIFKNLEIKLLEYCYRSTPRTKLGGKIYTATEYPADRVIPLHNENSYSKFWPQRLYFFCSVPALEEGETSLADSSVVYEKIDLKIKEMFEKYGLIYVRNYTQGIDLSWQEVFQTSDKEAVSKYCTDHDIEYEWKKGNPELTTKQTCQATLVHKVRKKKVWFNQAHIFHYSALDKDIQNKLIKELGCQNMPRNVIYGNGKNIEKEVIEHINNVYNKEKTKVKWKRGDLLLVDNIMVAHGRERFKGKRELAIAMA